MYSGDCGCLQFTLNYPRQLNLFFGKNDKWACNRNFKFGKEVIKLNEMYRRMYNWSFVYNWFFLKNTLYKFLILNHFRIPTHS